ncbi:hypothetical protein FOA52_000913 [Chlamydomonas sp. UWO 241]|nr:hypothetical protein FOA52_000913 [Chlamydomonas sp. UWO 241]
MQLRPQAGAAGRSSHRACCHALGTRLVEPMHPRMGSTTAGAACSTSTSGMSSGGLVAGRNGSRARGPTALRVAQASTSVTGSANGNEMSLDSMDMADLVPLHNDLEHSDGAGKQYARNVEMEPRFYGLRDINEKEGTFQAEFGLKVRWGPPPGADPRQPQPGDADFLPPPNYFVTDSITNDCIGSYSPGPLPSRDGWMQMSVHLRSQSCTIFKLRNFPYDVHKLRVVVRVPDPEKQGIGLITAVQESKSTPRAPDLGLQDWLVLRQRCYMRTRAPGNHWFLRMDAPTEFYDGFGFSNNEKVREGAAVALSVGKRAKAKGSSPKSKAWSSSQQKPKVEFVMEFLVQRRATYWISSVYLPLLAMESIVPMAFAMPVSDLSSRLILAVTLVIAPGVFKTALADRLPSVGYLTTMDRHFIFVYFYILTSCMGHAALHTLGAEIGFRDDLLLLINDLTALLFILILGLYHVQHYNEFFKPYQKRLQMFERRSFYAPPIIQTMDAWKPDSSNTRRQAGLARDLSFDED